jgi:excisionase family DNA binding protein
MTTAVTAPVGLPETCDLKTVRAHTGIAVPTLRDWIRDGRLPAYRLPGGQIRVRTDDVAALFERVTPKRA